MIHFQIKVRVHLSYLQWYLDNLNFVDLSTVDQTIFVGGWFGNLYLPYPVYVCRNIYIKFGLLTYTIQMTGA